MNTIITEIQEGISRFPDLQHWIRKDGTDPDSPDFDPYFFFEGDPDILRCAGNVLYFSEITINDTRYVLTSEEVCDTERVMLERFFSDDFTDSFRVEENSWKHFYNSPYAIAYRGGRGYFYSIWNYCNGLV